MKDRIFKVVASLALVSAFSAMPVFAQEHAAKVESMAKMDMEHMKGMKHDCMAKNKNGKMCDKEMMDTCQMKMSKGDCTKMMGHAMSPADKKTK